ncbi:CoB--CoM heterodisulfide reductase iron-sulfur subunit A family protein [Methanophagales archaeon]|nr:MAG: CoB--CoM heterodisulfide reductase iron-sulfur subunit A family protein [Methanophagales archaeon]RJS86248.1 MAG: CoB--CoM heterodisulfide reductase iron-sulfur subunit A family protein [Methanophagales archaeon]
MGIAVIGGGVAGITAALDLADSGYKVHLIEKNAELGGKMEELAECQMGLSPYIAKVENHPNINLMLSSELERLSGTAGDFKLSVSGNEVGVESVVLAPGYDIPEVAKSYGYGSPDVVVSLDFEGMLKAATVSETGELVRPSDGKRVKKLGFIKCVGSRCQENEICSTACCAYTAKEAWEVKERFPDIEIYIFYMDIRVFGKDEELVAELKDKYGVKYIRSRVPEVIPEEGALTVKFENLEKGTIEKLDLDMVVLAVGLLPSKTLSKLAEITGVKTDKYGYIETSLTSPLETSVPGILACGTATAPMKVRESVAQASGAALKAAGLSQRTEPIPGQEEHKYIEVGDELKTGVFICGCEGEIANSIDIPAVVERVSELKDVVYVNSETNTLQEAMDAIESGIVDQGLTRIVFAGQSPRECEDIVRDACAGAGLNPYLLEMVNLREQCAWVQGPKDATEAAVDMLKMAVERAKYLEEIPVERYPVIPKALVIGGGISGMNAALGIADAGYEVHLVDKGAELGGGLRESTELPGPGGEQAADVLKELVDKVTANERINVYTKVKEEKVVGRAGSFKAKIVAEGSAEDVEIEFGACVIATGARRDFVPEGYFGYGKEKNVTTVSEFVKMLAGKLDANTIALIQDVPGEGVTARYSSIEVVDSALKAKEKNPDANVFVLYQDIKTYGKWEVLYKDAREKGVIFLRYDKEKPPKYEDGIVSVYDVIFNDEIQIKPDLVVLSTPAMPAEANERLSEMFRIPLKNGFFMEKPERPKMVLTPVDTVNEGVFICGSAVYPAMIDECLAMSSAAASRACVLLAKDFLETPAMTSVVDEEICVGCGVCEAICPVEAIELTEEPVPVVTFGVTTVVGRTKKVAKVGDGCIGCGSCASYCPSSAMSLKYFRDKQVYAQLDYAV